jgi:opacity protein-like surface antigen
MEGNIMKKLILAVMALIPTLALANPGYYIQGQVGPSMSIPGIGFAGGIGAGYLWGDNAFNYGAEINVLTYSGIGVDIFSALTHEHGSGTDISLLGVLKYTFPCGFITFGKAGFAISHQEQEFDLGYLGTQNTSSTALVPEAAIGMGYQFNPNWEMDLTANHNRDNTNDNTDIFRTSILLGLTYHFA